MKNYVTKLLLPWLVPLFLIILAGINGLTNLVVPYVYLQRYYNYRLVYIAFALILVSQSHHINSVMKKIVQWIDRMPSISKYKLGRYRHQIARFNAIMALLFSLSLIITTFIPIETTLIYEDDFTNNQNKLNLDPLNRFTYGNEGGEYFVDVLDGNLYFSVPYTRQSTFIRVSMDFSTNTDSLSTLGIKINSDDRYSRNYIHSPYFTNSYRDRIVYMNPTEIREYLGTINDTTKLYIHPKLVDGYNTWEIASDLIFQPSNPLNWSVPILSNFEAQVIVWEETSFSFTTLHSNKYIISFKPTIEVWDNMAQHLSTIYLSMEEDLSSYYQDPVVEHNDVVILKPGIYTIKYDPKSVQSILTSIRTDNPVNFVVSENIRIGDVDENTNFSVIPLTNYSKISPYHERGIQNITIYENGDEQEIFLDQVYRYFAYNVSYGSPYEIQLPEGYVDFNHNGFIASNIEELYNPIVFFSEANVKDADVIILPKELQSLNDQDRLNTRFITTISFKITDLTSYESEAAFLFIITIPYYEEGDSLRIYKLTVENHIQT